MTAPGLRRALSVLLVAVLLHASALAVAAQSLATGALHGTVAGEAGRDVLVTLQPSIGGTARAASTDASGDVLFDFLPPGDYDVLVEKLGYVPRLISAIPVRPGRALHIQLRLEPVSTGAPARSEETWSGVTDATDQWISRDLLRHTALRRRTFPELDGFTSMEVRGTALEGIRLATAGGSLFGTAPDIGLHGTGSALVLREPLDVEWGRGATSLVAGHARAGASGTAGELSAEWSGSTLPGPTFADDVDSFNELSARGSFSSPLFGEGSTFTLGLEARRLQEPVSTAWASSESAAALVELAAERDVDFSDRLTPTVAYDEAFSGFMAMSTALSENHRLQLSAQASLLPRTSHFSLASGRETELEGHDAVASASLFSTLGENTANELRVAYTTSAREAARSDWTAGVSLVEDALGFGPLHPAASASSSTLQLSNAVHFRTRAHTIKFGLAASVAPHDIQHRAGGAGEYFFSSVAAMRADTGVFLANTGPATGAEWTDLDFAAFAQDTWRVFSGVELQAGIRAERASLPADDVRRDDEWLRLSGISSNAAAAGQWLLSPRASVRWDPQGDGRWLFQVNGGIYHDEFDPLLLSQWLLDDGSGRVRRIVGSTGWPAPPAGGTEVRRLSFLGSSFAPARTAQLSGGIARALAPGTTVELTGSFGRTTHLPRRTDLNALTSPVARDQHGRPIYGLLVQQGGILAATPGSGRRFPEYDEVAAISADGAAQRWGITAAIEGRPARALELLASYTFSRATDDWFGGADGGWNTLAPAGLPDDWLDARSDLDVPHRAALGLVYDAPFGLRLGALYSYRSGLPFTPGFRPGVDANGDGVAGNDPAFVDSEIDGMSALLSEWPCLADDAGGFASRNGCRTAAVQLLDLRAEVTVLRFGRGTAALAVEAFDVFESVPEVPDAALYLVDPGAALITSEEARTVTVPLVVNEAFGNPLTRRQPGRKLRLGVSLNW